jgi:signal transduction histidine kinase
MMSSASVLSLVCAVVAVNVVIFHGWLYVLRARDRANFHLAVTGLGVTGMTSATAFLYESHSVAASEFLQRFILVCAALTVLGFYHYTFAYFGIVKSKIRNRVTGLTVGLALVGMAPNLVFSDRAILRQNAFFDLDYVEAEISPFGKLFVCAFVPASVHFVSIFLRFLHRSDPNRRALIAVVCVWIAAVASDIGIAVGVHSGIALVPIGYTAFLIVLSAIQIRQIVTSMESLQKNRDRLGELIDRRTAELREKEMQITHGAQMATIGALAANLAHEINNPIAYVASNLNRVAESWSEPDESNELEEMLRECEEGIGRVRTTVSSLLALARRSDGVNQPVDLLAVIDSVLPIVRREAEARAQLECDISSVANVSGDPRLIGHVVLSLLTHAVRAIPSGAAELNRVVIATRVEAEQIFLSVRDTGRPIEPGQLERIFDPFAGFESTLQDDSRALAVPRQIIERHGGEIQVDSGSGGTTVTLCLPILH